MGAWGVEVFQNDGALDEIIDYLEPIVKRVDKVLTDPKSSAEEVRVAAHFVQLLIVDTGQWYGFDLVPDDVNCYDYHLDLAKKRLQEILDNPEETECWVDSEEFKESLRKQIAHLDDDPDTPAGLMQTLFETLEGGGGNVNVNR